MNVFCLVTWVVGGAHVVDFTKAFDNVIDSKLLAKIADLGLSYNNFKWFKNHLANRMQGTSFAWNISEKSIRDILHQHISLNI